ncbi:Maf family protein [Woodsholea maritima]|uniref:Maf family protein n=1 Tax=Woodsholea maritima TaxID=240237 RepID=UPI00035CF38F|nr:Maf family protein [Woodsholea maritima]
MSFILASGSASRRAILTQAGLSFDVDPAKVDEDILKQQFKGLDLGDLAQALADEKALDVSRRRADQIVIGGDQVLDLDGHLFDKAKTPEEARARLVAFRGKRHALKGGLAAALNGEVIWRHQSVAYLQVRAFSDAFLDDYMIKAGDILTQSVGAYAFEGLGAQLFDQVEGDYYAILGLDLIALLGFLRRQGVIAE